jgi:hypothetical protein
MVSSQSFARARASLLRPLYKFLVPLLAIACPFSAMAQQASNTTTALTLTAAGAPVSSVSGGTVVTLTATVTANGLPVTPGLVSFCDVAPAHCTDIHLLGTAQLTSAGVAAFKFIPGVGSHSYQAAFAGTKTENSSSTPPTSLTVTATGTAPSTTTIVSSGVPGNYTLTATVTGSLSAAPAGSVSFVDTTNANYVLATAPLSVGPTGLSLVNSATPAVGVTPTAIVVADFNGDGIPDIAVTDILILGSTPGTVSILLGKGDGTFSTASPVPVGRDPNYMAVGDFNHDGKPDLAISNQQDGTVTILLGNGDGTFAATPAILAGLATQAIAVGDFNNDGNTDLAVIANANSIAILLGNGAGNFSAVAPHLQTSVTPTWIAVGDFNGDGKLDLAVTNTLGAGPTVNGNVMILLGVGDGTFTPGATLSTGSNPETAVIGDFNNDGKLDLAVANYSSNNVTILLGNGDGTFTAAASPAAGTAPWSVSIGDFNGDGKPDLALVTTQPSTAPIALLLGNGDGTFTTVAGPTTGLDPIDGAVADFNGDGLSDFAVTNTTSNTVSIFLDQYVGQATATVTGISPVGAGTHYVDASYTGNTLYAPSVSNTVPLTGLADGTATTTTLTCNPSTLSVNSNSLFSITVSSAGGTPTGSILLTDNGAALTQLSLANGVASYTLTARQSGTRMIVATYVPTGSFAASSASCVLSVSGYTTISSLAASPTNATQGTPITLTAYVSGGPPGFRGSPVGSITFYNGSTVIDTGAHLIEGTVSFTTSTLPPGIDYLTCTYSGNATFAPSTCNIVPVTITQSSSAITLTSSLNPALALTPVTFTAQVAPGSSGTIVFNINGQNITTSPNAAGIATTTTSSLTRGDYLITASYYATPGTLTGQASLIQAINLPAIPADFSLTGTDVTVPINHAITGKLLLASIGGFDGSVALTCNPPYPPGFACKLQTSNVTLPNGFSTYVTYTLTPTYSATIQPIAHSTRLALAALFPLGVFSLIGFARKRRTTFRAILCLTVLTTLAAIATGCGPDHYIPLTTGTYPLTFTGIGTSQNDPTPITHTVTINVTIAP